MHPTFPMQKISSKVKKKKRRENKNMILIKEVIMWAK
jgi:hypothetical protein